MQKQQVDIQKANQGCPGLNSSTAGNHKNCQGCPNQNICQKGVQIDPSLPFIKKKMASIKHIILVLSGKGGVGKSTTATQLAMNLAIQQYQVGLLDIDLCGPSIPRMTGLQNSEVHKSSQGWSLVYGDIQNLGVMSIGFLLNNKNDAVIWRGPRKNGLIKQFLTDVSWGQLDFLIIDSNILLIAPPGTSDQHLSIIQYLQLDQKDGAIIVTTPQQVALLDVRKQINFCKKTNTRIIGVVENMSGFVCPTCKCESEIFPTTTGGAQKMCQQFELQLLGRIPINPKLTISSQQGKQFPIYSQIVQKIKDRLRFKDKSN